jgi:hypothetical protein
MAGRTTPLTFGMAVFHPFLFPASPASGDLTRRPATGRRSAADQEKSTGCGGTWQQAQQPQQAPGILGQRRGTALADGMRARCSLFRRIDAPQKEDE